MKKLLPFLILFVGLAWTVFALSTSTFVPDPVIPLKIAVDALVTTGDWEGTIDSNNFAGGAIGVGQLIYGGSAGSFSELAIGTNGNVLSLVDGLPAWVATSTCAQITGSAGLCDGEDATGGGGASYPFTVLSPTLNSTSTIISFTSGLASTSILGSFNTGTLTATSGTSYLQALTLGTKLPNTELANSSLTVTAGNGLTGGGAISLGGSATVDLVVDSTLTVSANSVGLALTNQNNWTANINTTGSLMATGTVKVASTTVFGSLNAGTITATSGTSYLQTISLGSAVSAATCALVTGGAGLCDGVDATGSGTYVPNHSTTTITFIADIDGAGWLCTNCPIAGTEFNPGVVVDLNGANKIRLGANCDVACNAAIVVHLLDSSNNTLASTTPTSLDTPTLGSAFNESLSGDQTLNIRIRGSAAAADDYRVTHVYAEISPQ